MLYKNTVFSYSNVSFSLGFHRKINAFLRAFFLFVLLFIAAPLPLWAQYGPAEKEEIQSFNVQLAVHADASVSVTEQLVFNVTGNQIKRGIIRELPIQGVSGYEVLSVKRDGRPERYTVNKQFNEIEIIIGNKNTQLLPGTHRYEIVYRAADTVRLQKDFDELYWNVTGNKWAVPIRAASLRLTLPQGAQIVPGGISLYTGRAGQKEKNAATDGNSLFYTTRPLAVGEGFTVSVAWNKGFINEASILSKWLKKIGLPLGQVRALFCVWAGLLVYYGVVWFFVGRDPQSRVLRRFDPPAGLSPAQVRYLWKMQYDQGVFSAVVMSLALKGRVHVTENSKVFSLGKIQATDADMLSDEEQQFLDALFKSESKVEVLPSSFDSLQRAAAVLKKSLEKWEKGRYFARNTLATVPTVLFVAWLIWLLLRAMQLDGNSQSWIMLTLFFSMWGYSLIGRFLRAGWARVFSVPNYMGMIFVALVWLAFNGWTALAVGIWILPGLIFNSLVRAYTKPGRELMDQVEGFLQYLQVAEKYRVFASDPTDAAQIYCNYLPYAAALDMQNKWREVFQTELGEAAAERAESTHGLTFTHQMAGFNAGLSSALSPRSSSGGGGSSGFGGGGFSGGGSGGGGGRGW